MWSNISEKNLPPITSTLEPSPIKSLSPKLDTVPVPKVTASSPAASDDGAEVPVDLFI